MAAGPDRIGWSDFLERWDWQQGEHVSLVGPTGCGKTTFALATLPMRKFGVVLGTKPRDATLDGLRRARPRWEKLTDWSARSSPTLQPRVILWPKFRRPEDVAGQRDQIAAALGDMFAEGGWTIYADELSYLVRQLGQADTLRLIWQQGRALGISLVGATQRPAWVPLELYSQATHVVLWKHNDPRDLDRLSGIASAGDLDPKHIRSIVRGLEYTPGKGGEFLAVNTRTGDIHRAKVGVG